MSSPITYDATGWLSNQGQFRSGRPWGRVVHTLECDAKPGIARELSSPGGYLDNQGLAPHGMSDPTQRVRSCNTDTIGGHVGGRGNPHVVGYEVSGRAAWTPQQWLDGGLRQAALESDAQLVAWDCVQDGWSRDEATRWLSGAQIVQNYNGGDIVRGLLEHNDVSEFIGGTNHWDPGEFVSEWFVARIGYHYDVYSGGTPVTPPPAKEWDEMASKEELAVIVAEQVRAQLIDLAPHFARQSWVEFLSTEYPYGEAARGAIAKAVDDWDDDPEKAAALAADVLDRAKAERVQLRRVADKVGAELVNDPK